MSVWNELRGELITALNTESLMSVSVTRSTAVKTAGGGTKYTPSVIHASVPVTFAPKRQGNQIIIGEEERGMSYFDAVFPVELADGTVVDIKGEDVLVTLAQGDQPVLTFNVQHVSNRSGLQIDAVITQRQP